MIDFFRGEYTPECDFCGARLAGERSFQNAINAMHDKGWRSRKVDGDWQTVCADCLFEEKGYEADD